MASSIEPAASPGGTRGSLWRRHTARPVAVALAVLAALAVWGISELVSGSTCASPPSAPACPRT
jgi:hypothetical protein